MLLVDPFAPLDGSTGRPKLATVAAALLKAKRAGQLPSAFGEIALPGIEDEPMINTSTEDSTACTNNQSPQQNNVNGIQAKSSKAAQQGGQPKAQGQQPLRLVLAIC